MESQFPEQMLQRLERNGVVSVLILVNANHAVPLAKALLAGGIDAMELTLRTAAAIDALKLIRQHVPDMLAGIGTVLNEAQVDEVMAAGAHFAVSPGLNPDVVERAQEIGLPFAPGVMTPSEIEVGLELGCREMKFFPAVPSGGLAMLDSIRAPYAHLGARFIPLGGINEANMETWLKNPAVFALGGSWLTPQDVIKAENWAEVTRRAQVARKIADSVRA